MLMLPPPVVTRAPLGAEGSEIDPPDRLIVIGPSPALADTELLPLAEALIVEPEPEPIP